MGELWLRSLLSAISEVNSQFDYSSLQLSPSTCSTEVVTVNVPQDLRIDLVIDAPDVVIGIENKIDATLYNNLCVYAGHISQVANDRQAVLLTLTLHDESVATNRWANHHEMQEVTLCNVTYEKLFEKVTESFGEYMTNADPEWITFVRDFMRTIENQGRCEMQFDSELFSFVNENLSEVLLFKEKLEEITSATKNQGVRLQQMMLDDEELVSMNIGKPAIYSPDKCYMYCSTYYNIPVGSKHGWAHPEISNELSSMLIRCWVSNASAKAEVKQAMIAAGIPIVEEQKNHLVMANLPLDADESELIEHLKILIKAILPIARR